MKQIAIAVLALSLTAVQAIAAPVSDPRIRVERYDPARFVKIYTRVGEPTLIQFESDERIVDTPEGMIGMGDSKAWTLGPQGSNIMLKPKAIKPDTKLLVVTTKRTYAFEIISIPAKSSTPPTNIVRFDYPDNARRLAEENARQAKLERERAQRIDAVTQANGPRRARNQNYQKQGHEALAPDLIEDDGRFTYLTYNAARPLPVVSKILPDGEEEAIANFHIEPETGVLVVHEVVPMLYVRYGKTQVMALRNDGYNPITKHNVLGTTESNAIRIQKDPL
jgi:type IV secretion system protein VirB9